MSLLTSVTEDTLNADVKPTFKQNEVVKFAITDAKDIIDKNAILVQSKIMSGDHAERQYSFYFADSEFEAQKKQLAGFLKAFWTPQQLLNKEAKIENLIGQEFQAKASKVFTSKKSGENFQNFSDFHSLTTPQVEGQEPTY